MRAGFEIEESVIEYRADRPLLGLDFQQVELFSALLVSVGENRLATMKPLRRRDIAVGGSYLAFGRVKIILALVIGCVYERPVRCLRVPLDTVGFCQLVEVVGELLV